MFLAVRSWYFRCAYFYFTKYYNKLNPITGISAFSLKTICLCFCANKCYIVMEITYVCYYLKF